MNENYYLDIIHLKFENPILHNIKEIYLKPKKTNYTNLSYINYYTEVYNSNINISFYGIFKDNYFVILIDIFDKQLNNSICDKNIIFIKADWILTKINNELFLYQINIIKNKNYKYFYLPLRKYFEDNNDLSIEDILSINDCVNYEVKINKKEEKEKIKPEVKSDKNINQMKDIHDKSTNQTLSNIKNKVQNKIKNFMLLFKDDD